MGVKGLNKFKLDMKDLGIYKALWCLAVINSFMTSNQVRPHVYCTVASHDRTLEKILKLLNKYCLSMKFS